MDAFIRPSRRLRFGLRTLLVVVTLVGLWLGWGVRAVHQRRSTLASIESRGGRVYLDRGEKHLSIPLIRRWLGDVAVGQIEPPRSGTLEEDEWLRELFPEAYVFHRVALPEEYAQDTERPQ